MGKKRRKLFGVGDRIRMLVNEQWMPGTIIYVIKDTGRIGVKFDGTTTGEMVTPTHLQYEDSSLPDTIAEFEPSSVEDLGSL